jgi:hypothetical protein
MNVCKKEDLMEKNLFRWYNKLVSQQISKVSKTYNLQ